MQIDDSGLTREEVEMEAALGALRPAAAGIDRDVMMFAAGEAAGRVGLSVPRVWPWKVAACVGFLCSTILLGVEMRGVPALGERPSVLANVGKVIAPPVAAQSADFKEGAAPSGIASYFVDAGAGGSPWAYHTMLSAVLSRGLDAIPAAPNGDASPYQATPAKEKGAVPLHNIFFQGDRS